MGTKISRRGLLLGLAAAPFAKLSPPPRVLYFDTDSIVVDKPCTAEEAHRLLASLSGTYGFRTYDINSAYPRSMLVQLKEGART